MFRDCHGSHDDIGRWQDNVHLDREDRLCRMCRSAQQLEDEHHLMFDCHAYSSIRAGHASLSQCTCSVSDLVAKCEANSSAFVRSRGLSLGANNELA